MDEQLRPILTTCAACHQSLKAKPPAKPLPDRPSILKMAAVNAAIERTPRCANARFRERG